MQNLIERLEKATGPDREIDDAIGAILERPCKNWPFTASIDAALTLVPKEKWFCVSGPHRGGTFDAIVGVGKGDEGKAATPAIALCIAALKARGRTLTDAETPTQAAAT